LTLSIRVLGGAIGYAIYFNVFSQKFVPNAVKYLGAACYKLNITEPHEIETVIGITAVGLLPSLKQLPQVGNDTAAYESLVLAGQIAYADSYPWVYYVSLAFGGLSIICSIFLGDIKKYMTSRVIRAHSTIECIN
jgi:hypothetical protein